MESRRFVPMTELGIHRNILQCVTLLIVKSFHFFTIKFTFNIRNLLCHYRGNRSRYRYSRACGSRRIIKRLDRGCSRRRESNEGQIVGSASLSPSSRLFRGRNKFRARAHAVDIPFALPMSFELQGSVQLEGEIGTPGECPRGNERLASGQMPLRYRRRRR